jgi:2-dehydro-3-deoxyphosphooctonate aldolase (KDO 8-P synthase)
MGYASAMTPVRPVEIAGQRLGDGRLFFIAGPCVLESRALAFDIAGALKDLFSSRGVPFVFKASYDKANRSSLAGGRGVGADEGLSWLADIRAELGVPTLTDVHQPDQCRLAAEAVDVLQIPAFLCRQTDLLVAAAETGKVVNVKKGQFLAPWDMANVAKKITDSGNPNVLVTERGVTHGYGRLVVDMTGFRDLRATGHPVVFDATHSVQRPGALGTSTGGDRTLAPPLARAAVATGDVDGLFCEVHPRPDSSPSDGPNMLELATFGDVVDGILAVYAAVRG